MIFCSNFVYNVCSRTQSITLFVRIFVECVRTHCSYNNFTYFELFWIDVKWMHVKWMQRSGRKFIHTKWWKQIFNWKWFPIASSSFRFWHYNTCCRMPRTNANWFNNFDWFLLLFIFDENWIEWLFLNFMVLWSLILILSSILISKPDNNEHSSN